MTVEKVYTGCWQVIANTYYGKKVLFEGTLEECIFYKKRKTINP